jgi:hypothetical protein
MNVILDLGKWSLELVVQSSCFLLLLGPFYSSRFAFSRDWIEMNVNTHGVGPFSRDLVSRSRFDDCFGCWVLGNRYISIKYMIDLSDLAFLRG